MKWNFHILGKMWGFTLLSMGGLLMPSAAIAAIYKEQDQLEVLLMTFGFSVVLGGLLVKYTKGKRRHMKIREGYLGIIISILIAILVGAVPFCLSYKPLGIVDGIFESAAGLSTTSATVIGEYLMPKSLIFWKASQHWIGGLGILIFIVAIMPLLGPGEQQLATAENQYTSLNKIAPRSKTIIQYLAGVYTGLTLISFIYFLICRLPSFDAWILALSCTSTSGVLLYPEGISHYASLAVEMGVSIFCILGGLSFVLYIHLIKGHFMEIKENIELKVFLGIIAISTLLVFLILYFYGSGKDAGTSMRDAFFQVSSFATTSGFALENYVVWPAAATHILFYLMLIGGCSSSTTGAFRVIRLVIVFKMIQRGVYKRIHPRGVRAVKVGKSVISTKMASSVTTFGILYVLIFLFSIVVLSWQNLDLETTISAAAGALSNDGISFGQIGMDGNYSVFSPALKLYLCFLMVVGRLGLLNVFILFLPSFWNPDKNIKIE